MVTDQSHPTKTGYTLSVYFTGVCLPQLASTIAECVCLLVKHLSHGKYYVVSVGSVLEAVPYIDDGQLMFNYYRHVFVHR